MTRTLWPRRATLLLPAAVFAWLFVAAHDARSADDVPPQSAAPAAAVDLILEDELTDAPAAGDASGESSRPANPFGSDAAARRSDALPGAVELSDGTILPGLITTTPGRQIRLFDAAKKDYRLVSLAAVLVVETRVEWERMDKEWRFKTAGSTEKVYTGRTYPNRMVSYEITLRDESHLAGDIEGMPIYVTASPGASPTMVVLHRRQKGEMGASLKDLVYVARIRFGDDARREAEAVLARRAAEKAAAETDTSARSDTSGGQP